MPPTSDESPPGFPLFQEALPAGLWEDLRRTFEPRYQLKGLLGQGGMGVVLEAWDPVLERSIAIKVLSTEALGADPSARERLQREARAAATLDHPNVVSVFGVGETAQLKVPYILMQRVTGASLERRSPSAPTLDVATAARILGDVAGALTLAHARGVIHRDLKPSNVIVDEVTGRAIVVDFGISHWAPTPGRRVEARLTGTGTFVGTPHYISPEQATGEPLTDRADIYSLGCLLYELLAGRPVFEAPSPMAIVAAHINTPPTPIRELRPEVPEALSEVLMAMLAKRPEDRPSADQLRRRFAAPPEHHPWTSGVVEAVRRRLRLVVLSGAALTVSALVQYGALSGSIPLTARVLQTALLATTLLAMVLYAGVGLAAIGEFRRAALPSSVIQLIAGDWSGDAGLAIDRLREYARLSAEDQRAVLAIRRLRGLGSLLVGPATLFIMAVLVALPRMGGWPEGARWSLLLLPTAYVLATMVAHARMEYRVGGLAVLIQRSSATTADRQPFLTWAEAHAPALPGMEGRGRGWMARLSIHLLTIVTTGISVLLLAGIQLFAANVRDSAGTPPPWLTVDIYHEIVRLAQLAPPVARPLSDDSARMVWDELFLEAQHLSPSVRAVKEQSWRFGMDVTFSQVGLRLPSGRNRGLSVVEAAYRGFTSAQRTAIDSVLAASRLPLVLTASRARRSYGREALMAVPGVADAPAYALPTIEQWMTWPESQTLVLAAARQVDTGRPDSAEALLWSALRFAHLQAEASRDLRSILTARRSAGLAAGALQAIYTREHRLGPLVALLGIEEGPAMGWLIWLPNGAAGDPDSLANHYLRQASIPTGERWEVFLALRYSTCGRTAALLGGADPAYDSAAVFVRDSLVRDAADSALLRIIDLSLVNAAAGPSEGADGRSADRLLLRASRLANWTGKTALAGCLKAAGTGNL